MRKKTIFLVMSIIICSLLFVSVGCSSKIAILSDIDIDEDHILTWSRVNDARSYSIEIINVDTEEIISRTSRRTDFSLAFLEEGDYTVKIKAIAGHANDTDSEWSKAIDFHKPYETGLIYKLINGNTEYRIERAGTATGSIVIEDIYRDKPVTEIADGAFRARNTIESIVIGNNVRRIGDFAFYNCSRLQSITIPDSVTEIGTAAFQGCNQIESITLPKDITVIQPYTFAYCRALTEINFGSKITRIMEYAFAECSDLESITIPDSVVSIGNYVFSNNSILKEITLGKGLQILGAYTFAACHELTTVNFGDESQLLYIDMYAFTDCKALTELSLPETLLSIGAAAFFKAENLSTINIPDSVNKIGVNAFLHTKLLNDALEAGEQLVYAGNWLVFASTEFKNEVENFTAGMFKEGTVGIADQALIKCKLLYTVTFPQSMRYIGDYAFYDNQTMYRVNIPNNSVEYIGSAAFMACPSLSVLNMGSGVKGISSYAFYGCSRLDNSTNENISIISETVNSIGFAAFMDTALWEKPDESGIIYAGNWAVGYQEGITDVVLRGNTIGVSDLGFYGCGSLSSISGIHNVRYLGLAAFYNCERLASVQLNQNLRTIQPYTFYNCSQLYTIDLPLNLTSIGRSAFYGCTRLVDINLEGTNVETIDIFAFYGCSNMQELRLGTKLKDIGMYAFFQCASLEEVIIPDSVTAINDRTFYQCTSLKSVTIGKGVTYIGNSAFSGCTALKTVEIPSSVKNIGNFSFLYCEEVTSLTLNEGLESVGNYAFYGLTSLRTLSLPKSLVSIGSFAFAGCSNLSSVNINSTSNHIDAHAFYGCLLATIYVDSQAELARWHGHWNSSYRPVIFSSTYSEDNTYVVSVKVSTNSIKNPHAINGISAPTRAGYLFVGWATNPDALEAEFSAKDILLVEAGTTLYSIWTATPEAE